jgi:hypothetical protein
VFVGGLGEADFARFGDDSLSEGYDGFRYFDFSSSHKLLLQIFDTDFQMQLSGSGYDVFSALFDCALYQGITLGQSLQSFYQFGEIGGVLGFHSNSYYRGYGEFHGDEGERRFIGGQGSRFNEELIDSNQSASVSNRYTVYGFGLSAHHNYYTLYALNEEIVLLSYFKVGSQDSDLLAG